MSIMPEFTFLSATEARAIAEYLFYLGDRNAAEFLILPPAGLRERDAAADGEGYARIGRRTDAPGLADVHRFGSVRGQADLHRALPDLPRLRRQRPWHRTAARSSSHRSTSRRIPSAACPTTSGSGTCRRASRAASCRRGRRASPRSSGGTSSATSRRCTQARSSATLTRATFPLGTSSTDPLPVTVDNIDAGKRIWTRECMVCHGDAATGEGIYRQGIEPVPPDFSALADYADFTDGDYFWRISEGVPWTAMPAWKVQYTPNQRWQLVQYIRTMFTQTLPAPPKPPASRRFLYTHTELASTIPPTAKYDAGRQQFLVSVRALSRPGRRRKGLGRSLPQPEACEPPAQAGAGVTETRSKVGRDPVRKGDERDS